MDPGAENMDNLLDISRTMFLVCFSHAEYLIPPCVCLVALAIHVKESRNSTALAVIGLMPRVLSEALRVLIYFVLCTKQKPRGPTIRGA